MSSLLFSVSSIAFYLGSKHFPSDLEWSELGKIGRTTYARITAWITLVTGVGLEIMYLGVLTGVFVSLWSMMLFTSLYILGVSRARIYLVSILIMSLGIAFIREFIDYAV